MFCLQSLRQSQFLVKWLFTFPSHLCDFFFFFLDCVDTSQHTDTQLFSDMFSVVFSSNSVSSQGGFWTDYKKMDCLSPGLSVTEIWMGMKCSPPSQRSQWGGYMFVCEQDQSFCWQYHPHFVFSAKALAKFLVSEIVVLRSLLVWSFCSLPFKKKYTMP